MVVQMINVGEATGALDAMLGKIADFYDDEVDAAVAALTSLLEPMLMVFLGTVIGFIVIAMYLPIFKMAAVVRLGGAGASPNGCGARRATPNCPQGSALARHPTPHGAW